MPQQRLKREAGAEIVAQECQQPGRNGGRQSEIRAARPVVARQFEAIDHARQRRREHDRRERLAERAAIPGGHPAREGEGFGIECAPCAAARTRRRSAWRWGRR